MPLASVSLTPAVTPHKRSPLSWTALGLVVAVLLRIFVSVDDWSALRVTKYDVFGYYLYLPAAFVYHDVAGLAFVPAVLQKYDLTNRDNPAHPLGNYEVSRAQTNPDRYVIKYTMGQALLWSPFFGAAHLYVKYSGTPYPADGYSAPYQVAMYLAGFFYALLGLFLLRKFLLYYFSDALTAVLLLVIYCGTNYLCYAVGRSLYAHNALFTLHSATLLLTYHWLRHQRLRYILGLALSIGLAVLIRPSEIIILLVPWLLGVASEPDFRARLELIQARRFQMLCFGIGVGLVMLPQLLYWHYTSGHWTYDSYPGESFDFRHPRLFSGLFSFNNGWLTYTPVMLLAVAGLAVLWVRQRGWFWLAFFYLGLHVYISYSWWCWWYMDSFGSRAMVQTYALLSIPLGFCLRELFRRGLVVRVLTGAALVFFIVVNGFQLWQLRQGIFVSENMTRRYYGAIFGKTHLTAADLTKFDTNEAEPKLEKYMTETVFTNDFSKDTTGGATTEFATAPPAYRLDATNKVSPSYSAKLADLHAKRGDWLQAEMQAFFPEREYGINQMPGLVIEFKHPGQDQSYKWQNMRVTNKVGQVTTVYEGSPQVWGKVGFATEIPKEAQADDVVKVYAHNQASQRPLFIDDLTVSILRQQNK